MLSTDAVSSKIEPQRLLEEGGGVSLHTDCFQWKGGSKNYKPDHCFSKNLEAMYLISAVKSDTTDSDLMSVSCKTVIVTLKGA